MPNNNNQNNNFQSFGNNMENNQFANNIQHEPMQPQTQQPQPKIEIPQEYYDQLAKEKEEEEALKNKQPEPVNQNTENTVSKLMFPLSLVTTFIVFVLTYLTVNVNELLSAGLIIYVFLGAIIFAIKNKKKSEFPTSVLIGSMICAIICFIVSMLNEEEVDLWTYYTIVAAATGFIGMIAANIITRIISEFKKIKALETIGYILFFAILLVGPYLAYTKYPTEFYSIVFYRKTEIKADTYEDFVIKTLKGRYNLDFTCDFANSKDYKTEKKEIMTKMGCKDPNGNKLEITTIAYNEGNIQYTVIDNYMNVLYFNEIEEEVEKNLLPLSNGATINVYFYPIENCTFIGDCADCDEYYEIYQIENSSKNRYEVSKNLNFSKYVGLTNKEFIQSYINENKYKIIISIRGNYTDGSFDFLTATDNILNSLNNQGFKNTYGFEVFFNNYSENSFEKKVFHVKGKTNKEQTFKNPEIQDL